METQAVPVLVRLLEHNNPDLKTAVIKALATLAQEGKLIYFSRPALLTHLQEQAQGIMVATRALPIFASLLNNAEPDVVIAIANALPELVLPGSKFACISAELLPRVVTGATCTEMLKTNMISTLAGLLNHSDSDVKSSVAKALVKLAEDGELVQLFSHSDHLC